MSGWGTARRAARLQCAAALSLIYATPALAQTAPAPAAPAPTDPAELDPSAPLDALPGLGVDWPTLDTTDAASSAESSQTQQAQAASDETGERNYAVEIQGLGSFPASEDLLKSFRSQSALEANRKRPANAAQIARRSRADADLLEELLRSQGYYDADVEPRTEPAGAAVKVILEAAPGEQYRFASVELPGLEAAGSEATKLRDAFAVKAGDPVIAQDVIAGGVALQTALGELGFAGAKVGEQQVEVDHATHLATLVLPVDSGPIARFGAIRVAGKPPFSARHLWTMARFKPGQRFERSKIDDLRRALINTSLVSAADIRVVPANDGRTVDLDVRLEPAPSHTIAGEIGYGTGEGARLEASWTDRNFFNPEGALTLRGIAGTSE